MSRLASVTYPNNQTTAYAYLGNAGDRRLQTIHHKRPDRTTLSKFDYVYDATGNILSWFQQTDGDPVIQWQYTYDAADELMTAVESSTTPSVAVLKRYAYGYDLAKNRTVEQIDDAVSLSTYNGLNRLQGQTPGGSIRVAGTVSEPSSLTVNGRPATVTSDNRFAGSATVASGANTVTVVASDASGNSTTQRYTVDLTGPTRSFAYDANGNLLSDGSRTFEWDARNQLVAVNMGTHRTEYAYDFDHRRVRVVEKVSGVAQADTRMLWCGTDICEERSTSSGVVTRRLFDRGESSGSGVLFYSKDHLGSVRDVLDGSGHLQARYAFDPFGRRVMTSGTDVVDSAFTGHRATQTGLVLAQFRSYDPDLGRWLSEDPLGMRGSMNFYNYVKNKPVRDFDPFGLAGVTTVKCDGHEKELTDTFNGICKQAAGNDKCRKVLAQYGAQDCIDKDCKSGIRVVCCQSCGGCGENLPDYGGQHNIQMNEAGLRGNAACGGRDQQPWSEGPRHTLAHEMAHCRVGADNQGRGDPNWAKAEDIAYACRGDAPPGMK
jgi:RHS repeat-associated protein